MSTAPDPGAIAPGSVAPAGAGLHVLPVPGLPDFRPGDDLAGAIHAAAPWLVDGDVLVVTSKAVSKVEGRLVRSPTDPAGRDEFRRRLIDEHTVRLVAQIGRTRIVENALGIVAAAAGIDASNVHLDEIALLPVDPDASAAALVRAFGAFGVRVGVVITDTQGRAWRMGVTDVAIGAAGVPTTDDHRGGVDEHGNELVVTVVALGDEIAAAADLVKGKLSGVPVAVVRGLDAPGGRGRVVRHRGGGRALIRPAEEDLFRLGTDLAIRTGMEQGAREAMLSLERAAGAQMDAFAQFHLAQQAVLRVRDDIGLGISAGFTFVTRAEEATGRIVVLVRQTPPVGTGDPPATGEAALPAVARAGIVLQAIRGFLAVDGIHARWITGSGLETRDALLGLELG